MKVLKSRFLVLALLLCGLISGAQANTYSLPTDGTPISKSVTGSFTDYLTFNLATPGSFSYSVVNIPGVQQLNLGPFVFTLTTNINDLAASLYSGTPAGSSSLVSQGPLSVGDYFVKVTGLGAGTSGLGVYGVVATLAPVPEPGEWALMLSGIGLIGFMMRRRTSV